MPITSLMPVPKQRYYNNAGNPLVNGELRTYAAGTLIPKPTYTDSAGTIAQPNPIPLNVRGEPAQAIFWSGAYDIELYDSLGNLIYSVPNYNTDPANLWTLPAGIRDLEARLAAPPGSNIIGYIQAGVAAYIRTLQSKARETVSLEDYGAIGDGTSHPLSTRYATLALAQVQYPLATALTQEIDFCALIAAIATGAKRITLLAKSYFLGTGSVTLSTTRDFSFVGAGMDATFFVTTIIDGSPVFRVSGQWQDIRDFKINSFGGVAQNFVGIEAGTAILSFTRSRLRVKVSNAATGVKCRGWINDIDVFATFCSVRGFEGLDNNACVMRLKLENNIQDFSIIACFGTTITNLLAENTFTSATTTITSVIDNFQGLTIDSMYIEGGHYSTTIILFAGTVASQNLTLGQIQCTTSPGDRTDAIVIDRVNGARYDGNMVQGGLRGTLSATANARGLAPFIVSNPGTVSATNSTQIVHDNSKQIRRAQNWFGDTYLDHYLNTFDLITKSGVVTSVETANVITGRKGIRIEASIGVATRFVTLRRTVSVFPLVANLVGKTFKMFAWVFVPALAKYVDTTYQPAFEINLGGGASIFSATQRNMKAGCWNLVETPAITAPAGWTGAAADRFEISFFANNTATAVTDAGYYIIVDSIYITDGTVSILDIQRGNVEDYPLMGIRSDGHNMFVKSDSYNTVVNADSAIILGDRIEHVTPAAAGRIGKVCTTAGALGGAAVFKPWGPIDP